MCGSAFSLSSLPPAVFDVTPKVITRHLHYTVLRTQSLYKEHIVYVHRNYQKLSV